jgi:hypothetical protein
MARGKVVYGQTVRQPNRYFIDDKEVAKAKFDAAFPSHPIEGGLCPMAMMETSKSWPRISDAWGVGKGQKNKAEEVFRKRGVPTEFVSDGAGGFSAVIRNNAHQRDLQKAFGRHNNDGGYGQVTG